MAPKVWRRKAVVSPAAEGHDTIYVYKEYPNIRLDIKHTSMVGYKRILVWLGTKEYMVEYKGNNPDTELRRPVWFISKNWGWRRGGDAEAAVTQGPPRHCSGAVLHSRTEPGYT